MTYRPRCPWLPRRRSTHCTLLRQKNHNQKTWRGECSLNRAEECACEGMLRQGTEVVEPFPAQSHKSRFKLSIGRSRSLFSHLSMLRWARVSRLRCSPCIHQRVFSFKNMAAESTGTHKDPVTGEMISKQHVLVQKSAFTMCSSISYVQGTQASRKAARKRGKEGC